MLGVGTISEKKWTGKIKQEYNQKDETGKCENIMSQQGDATLIIAPAKEEWKEEKLKQLEQIKVNLNTDNNLCKAIKALEEEITSLM